MIAARGISVAASLVGLVLFARLLDPAAFGTLAIAIGVIAFAETICEFGLRSFLVREAAPSPALVGAATGLTSAITLGVVTLCLVAAATWPAGLGGANASSCLAVLALGLLVMPATLPVLASLQRSLSFGPLAAAATARVIVEVGGGLVFVLHGWGVLGLAAGITAGRVAEAVVLLMMGGGRHLARPRRQGWKRFMRFGRDMSAATVLSRSADLIVLVTIERLLGTAALGLFDRARAVTGLLDRTLLEGVKPVVLPALSRTMDDGASAAEVYRVKVVTLASLCWPVFAAVAVAAEPLVSTLLGEDWLGAVPAIHALCLAGLFVPFTKMSQKFFAAIDATGAYLRLQAVSPPVLALLVGLGATHSLTAACLGLSFGLGVKAALIRWALHRRLGFAHPPLARPLARAALTSGLVAATATAASWAMAGSVAAPLVLASIIVSCALAWVSGAVAVRDPLLDHLRRALPVRRLSLRDV